MIPSVVHPTIEKEIKSECRLCRGISDPTPNFWDRVLFESRHFVVVASLGALVEGWLLIVPKEHVVSFGAISRDLEGELETLKADISAMVNLIFGGACIFEHGPAGERRAVGCGVDHAHLHVVPIKFDLAAAVSRLQRDAMSWQRADFAACRIAYQLGNDYLYLEQPIGYGVLYSAGTIGSQVFRKAIASELGFSEQFNWRNYPQFANVRATTSKVEAYFRENRLVGVSS